MRSSFNSAHYCVTEIRQINAGKKIPRGSPWVGGCYTLDLTRSSLPSIVGRSVHSLTLCADQPSIHGLVAPECFFCSIVYHPASITHHITHRLSRPIILSSTLLGSSLFRGNPVIKNPAGPTRRQTPQPKSLVPDVVARSLTLLFCVCFGKHARTEF